MDDENLSFWEWIEFVLFLLSVTAIFWVPVALMAYIIILHP